MSPHTNSFICDFFEFMGWILMSFIALSIPPPLSSTTLGLNLGEVNDNNLKFSLAASCIYGRYREYLKNRMQRGITI